MKNIRYLMCAIFALFAASAMSARADGEAAALKSAAAVPAQPPAAVAANQTATPQEIVEESEFMIVAVPVAPFADCAPNCPAASAHAAADAKPEVWNVPYGNLGLDWTCNQIENANTKLGDMTGVKFFFDYYATVLTNPYGGAEQGTNYNHIMIFGLLADLEKTLGWKGAKFVISGAHNAGGNLSDKIGNFFTASEASVTDGAMFYELYLAQSFDTPLGEGKVRLGRMTMSDTFMSLPAFGYLVSGGMDLTPEAIFSNSPYTSTPIATWGITAQLQVEETVSLAAGLYQIPQNVESPNWDGTNFGIESDDGYMMIFQATWTPTFNIEGYQDGLQGIYQGGGWLYGGYDMPAFEGNWSRGNAYGFYLQGQQQVWVDPNNSDAYVSVWAGAQYAPVQSIAIMPWMLYSGVQLQGLIPQRPDDGIYISWLYGYFSSSYSNAASTGYNATYEMVIEATYVIQLNEYVSIQPDFQYIFRPNGNDNIDDALVIGGQLLVSF